MPTELRERLEAVADANKRSLTAEITDRLERSFEWWLRVTLPPALYKASQSASEPQRAEFNQGVNDAAADLALDVFSSEERGMMDLLIAFNNLMDTASTEVRDQIEDSFIEMLDNTLPLLGDQAALNILGEIKVAQRAYKQKKRRRAKAPSPEHQDE